MVYSASWIFPLFGLNIFHLLLFFSERRTRSSALKCTYCIKNKNKTLRQLCELKRIPTLIKARILKVESYTTRAAAVVVVIIIIVQNNKYRQTSSVIYIYRCSVNNTAYAHTDNVVVAVTLADEWRLLLNFNNTKVSTGSSSAAYYIIRRIRLYVHV